MQMLQLTYRAELVRSSLCEVMLKQRCRTYPCILNLFSVPSTRAGLWNLQSGKSKRNVATCHGQHHQNKLHLKTQNAKWKTEYPNAGLFLGPEGISSRIKGAASGETAPRKHVYLVGFKRMPDTIIHATSKIQGDFFQIRLFLEEKPSTSNPGPETPLTRPGVASKHLQRTKHCQH